MATLVNVSSIGNVYLVVDEYGNRYNIQIVTHSELISSTIGEYSEDYYKSYSEYMSMASSMMSGFIKSEYDVHWHRVHSNNFELATVIANCVDQGATMAIIEFIDQELLAIE